MVGTVRTDINPDLGHYFYRLRVEAMRLGPGRAGFDLIGKVMIDDAIGHLAAARIAGTEKQYLLFVILGRRPQAQEIFSYPESKLNETSSSSITLHAE